jgi:hypothetical protein
MDPTVTVPEPLPPCVNAILGVDVSEKSDKAAVELALLEVVAVVVWLTEKVAEALSPLGLPVAVTV